MASQNIRFDRAPVYSCLLPFTSLLLLLFFHLLLFSSLFRCCDFKLKMETEFRFKTALTQQQNSNKITAKIRPLFCFTERLKRKEKGPMPFKANSILTVIQSKKNNTCMNSCIHTYMLHNMQNTMCACNFDVTVFCLVFCFCFYRGWF